RHTRSKRDWSSDVCSSDLPRAAALDQAISLARPQDTILAAGRGHETQQDFAGEVIAIDDREVLRQSLVDHGFITHKCASTEDTRSEERRVGNECSEGRSAD